MSLEQMRQILHHEPKAVDGRNEKVALKVKLIDFKRKILKDGLKIALIQLIVTAVVLCIVIGIITQDFQILLGNQESIYIAPLFTVGFKYPTPYLILFILLNVFVLYVRITRKRDVTKDDRNFDVSNKGTYGTANFMDKEQQESTFYSLPVEDTTGNILGVNKDNESEVMSLRKLAGISKHKIVFGATGSRKTRSQVIPDIFQCILRGESFCASDPKGEVYGKTARVAEKHGYTVKVLNLKPEEMMHSDGCHMLGLVGDNTLMAQTIATTIIKNTADAKSAGFWEDGAKSLLTSLILYTTMNTDLKDEEKTLGSMYEMLINNNPSKLSAIFNSLDNKHPAKKSYAIFNGGEEKAKSGTWQGLCIRLQTLIDETVQEVVSNDEISFSQPAYEKCAYYIIVSDQETTMNFISAMFFSLFFIKLVAIADAENDKCLPITMNLIMDEFPSIGTILDFEKKEATVRSRGINITIIAQNIGQLKDKYLGNVWNTIISNCATQILLASNDEDTSTFFSNRTGTMTVAVQSKTDSERRLDPLKTHTMYKVSDGLGKRATMDAYEMSTLGDNEEIVIIQGRPVIKMHKFDYSQHPLAVEMEEINAIDHIPEWQLRKMKTEQERIAKIPKMPKQEEMVQSTPAQKESQPSKSKMASVVVSGPAPDDDICISTPVMDKPKALPPTQYVKEKATPNYENVVVESEEEKEFKRKLNSQAKNEVAQTKASQLLSKYTEEYQR